MKSQEREEKEALCDALPYYYFEIAQLLLNECSDEFINIKQSKSLVEDIFELRKEKLVRNMKKIVPDTPILYLYSAAASEINYVRPAFTYAHTIANK